MSIFRYTNSAFDDMLHLQRSLERSLRQPFWGRESITSGGAYPAINVFEKGETVVVKAEVPGLRKENIGIEIEGTRLLLSGTRVLPEASEEVSYHRRERQEGEFRRVVRLPYAVDRERAKASYEDGILTVQLEKAEAAKRHKIGLN